MKQHQSVSRAHARLEDMARWLGGGSRDPLPPTHLHIQSQPEKGINSGRVILKMG